MRSLARLSFLQGCKRQACILMLSALGAASAPAQMVQHFAPTGVLRAAMNLGNPILARKDATTGLPVGVSVDLATGLAQRLGVPLQLVVFDAAGKACAHATGTFKFVKRLATGPRSTTALNLAPGVIATD